MDALVAYGSDSDEESQQHGGEQGSQEEGVFSDFGSEQRPQQQSPQPKRLEEPRPPRRQSELFDDDDEDIEGAGDRPSPEEEVDSLLEKGLSIIAAKDTGGSTPGPEYTPRSACSTDEPMEMEEEEPENAIQHRELPPSPFGQCDPELERRFAQFFETKERGVDMRGNIKQRKDYKNPALYESLRDRFGIDQMGTNFPKAVYDPNAFRPEDFYDALGDHQAAQEARRKKLAQQQEQQYKRPASFPTAGGVKK